MTDTPTLSRRTALATTGAALTGGLGVAIFTGRAEATASVSASMSLADATHRSEKGSVADVWLQVTGSYSYDVTHDDATTDAWRVRVEVGTDGSNWDPLSSTSSATFGYYTGNGQYSTQGALVDTAAFDATMFDAGGDGKSVSVPVHARATFEVLNGDAVVVDASDTDSATLVIEDTTKPYDATLEGSGTWEWQANETDGSPVPP